MEFLDQKLIVKVWIFFEKQFDAVSRFDVFKLFHFEFIQVLQAVLFVFLDNSCDLRMIDESSQPEFGNPLNNCVALVIKRPSQFVVLLLHLQDLFAGLFVECVNFILVGINFL